MWTDARDGCRFDVCAMLAAGQGVKDRPSWSSEHVVWWWRDPSRLQVDSQGTPAIEEAQAIVPCQQTEPVVHAAEKQPRGNIIAQAPNYYMQ